MRQTIRSKLLNRFQRRTRLKTAQKNLTVSSTLKASDAYSKVCTIAAGIVRTIIHNSQKDQLSGQFVEQKNRELFEQKNTIPKELNSYNFGNLLDYAKIGSKHPQTA
jgi:hypothetical protein